MPQNTRKQNDMPNTTKAVKGQEEFESKSNRP